MNGNPSRTIAILNSFATRIGHVGAMVGIAVVIGAGLFGKEVVSKGGKLDEGDRSRIRYLIQPLL
jgi:hypothetical protein